MTKDKMTNNDWFNAAYNSAKDTLLFAMNELGFSYEKAKEYTKERSAAGLGVWAKLDQELAA